MIQIYDRNGDSVILEVDANHTRGLQLAGRDLTNANFSGLNLKGSDFTNSNLTERFLFNRIQSRLKCGSTCTGSISILELQGASNGVASVTGTISTGTLSIV